MTPAKRMEQRLKRLQEHLKRENPVLVESVNQYRELDAIAQKLGLLDGGESYATQISWWPLVSILGTFSAGKSSFINSYLDVNLQRTGNQAVDDRFTVITYSPDGQIRTLPGLALDGDPRFPFYQISEEIEHVSAGDGARIDNYLQMKVAPSEKLRGKILIDSPGFDADEQRKATLRITDHIIELSDLVLVFFDARHPEPGAMQDTLEHLVKGAMRRNDSSKFLFILNQIDTSAREDNLEDIVSAWQKALVQQGLSAGSFHILFNDKLATPVEDQAVWSRYVSKREADYQRIMTRIDSVNIERVYRIVGSMESQANQIEQQAVPRLREALSRWKKQVLFSDMFVFGLLAIALVAMSIEFGYWEGLLFNPPWLASMQGNAIATALSIIVPLLIAVSIHFLIRNNLAKRIAAKLGQQESYGNLSRAFLKSTRMWRSIFQSSPSGWGRRARQRLDGIRYATDRFVQHLNDRFTSPSGGKDKAESP
ncbi:MAG: dynamin family protein [Gammaproteobacteria bacterium]|nr:dynamin family protein [Gammaproteobacteria bacterium]MBU1724718.1 dynamin family protein [Gammaproteobacteria bacterium]MBU2006041.1 dynamin family protein [Gammaproteobacteria bacterium]